MPWETTSELDDHSIESIYAWDSDAGEDSRVLVFQINRDDQQITYYPKDAFCVPSILLEGFGSIPAEINEAGYMPGGIQYYLDKKLKDLPPASLAISKSQESLIRKVAGQGRYRVRVSYNDFQDLKRGLTRISTEATAERSAFVDEHFASVFPTRFTSGSSNTARRRASRVLRNLDTTIIPELDAKETEAVVEFVAELVAKRYTSADSRLKLMRAAKIKVDEVALGEVINKYEDLLAKGPPEKEWGEFLRKNLYLVDSKYIGVVPELNVALASQRKADFGLVDTDGYLDIFEIKKPSTKLLAASSDRGNFYWHADATKAIVQAEMYLHRAERKAASLTEDIKRERGVDVRVVRPKAIVLMGHSDQLTDQDREQDLRVLRQSLKNVEIVTYDELLVRLKNQQGKIYSDPDIVLEASVDNE